MRYWKKFLVHRREDEVIVFDLSCIKTKKKECKPAPGAKEKPARKSCRFLYLTESVI